MKILFPLLMRRGAILLVIIVLALFRFKVCTPDKVKLDLDLDLKTSFTFENYDGHKPIQFIFIHCSGSNSKHNTTKKDIMQVAKERGFLRPPYHFYLPRTGMIDTLCMLNDDKYIDPSELCWGVAGVNSVSIHICYEGCFVDLTTPDNRNNKQKENLLRLIHKYKGLNPQAIILGHRDYPNVRKLCPGFNAKNEYQDIW